MSTDIALELPEPQQGRADQAISDLPIVECSNLGVIYSQPFSINPLKVAKKITGHSDVTGVEGINFSLARGDIVLVAGSSGQGKTSLLKALSGSLDKGNSKVVGNVSIDGQKVNPNDLQRDVRIIGGFHDIYRKSIKPPLAVLEELARGQNNVNENENENSQPPHLVVLDELTRNLSPDQFPSIGEQVRRIAENSAVIIVSHDISMGLSLSNKFVHLQDNKVLFQGMTSTVENNLSSLPYATQELITLAKKMEDQPSLKPNTQIRSAPTEFKEQRSFNGNKSVLSVSNLSVAFHDKGKPAVQAVDDVSFDIQKGEIFAFIGSSGCGKSTTIKSLNHMLKGAAVVSGDVQLNGVNLDQFDDPVDIRKQFGYVAQHAQPFSKTILNDVTYGAVIHGVIDGSHTARRELAEKVLKKVGLWDEIKDKLETGYGHSLSGGQQQRLCIARALAMKPKILLMDEPCSALDPIATADVEDVLTKLSEEGHTIVIVTHSMGQAARIADRTAYMESGRIVECDNTMKIMVEPQHDRTRKFVTGSIG